MSPAARSIYVFGIYLLVLGGILIGAPNTLLTLFGLPTTTEPWAHVLGVPVMGLGMFHLASARAEQTHFFRTSVGVRLFVLASLTALTLVRITPPIIIVFGVVDAAGALWTFAMLRKTAVKATAA